MKTTIEIGYSPCPSDNNTNLYKSISILDLKYVDTRTFTRPKKKLFTCPDVNSTYAERRNKTPYDDLVNN